MTHQDPMATTAPDFSLDDFLPYRLVKTAEHVADGLARLYQQEFGITRPEWRIIASLGAREGIRAKDLADETSLDKVRVSRTLASLEKKGLLAKSTVSHDHRAAHLNLTEKGLALYSELIPKVLAWEQGILDGMGEGQYRDLVKALDFLTARAGKEPALETKE